MAVFTEHSASNSAVVFAIIAGLYGLGGGVFQVSNIKNAAKVTPNRRATAGSLLRLFQNLGIALGATVALNLLPTSEVIDTNVNGSSMIWGTAAGAILFLFALSILQREQEYKN